MKSYYFSRRTKTLHVRKWLKWKMKLKMVMMSILMLMPTVLSKVMDAFQRIIISAEGVEQFSINYQDITDGVLP